MLGELKKKGQRVKGKCRRLNKKKKVKGLYHNENRTHNYNNQKGQRLKKGQRCREGQSLTT